MGKTGTSGAFAIVVGISAMINSSVRAQVFPGQTWSTRDPSEVGLNAAHLDELVNMLNSNYAGTGTGGTDLCVIKDGYLVYSSGDVSAVTDTWHSASKPSRRTYPTDSKSETVLALCSVTQSRIHILYIGRFFRTSDYRDSFVSMAL